ncbi:MAG: hypothetical protein ACK5NT_08115 [Pyrinomonadaceae bacterium]
MNSILGNDDGEPLEENAEYNNETEFVELDNTTDSRKSGKDKKTFAHWLETPEAIQMVYLVFGFFAILLLMILLQYSTRAICCGDQDGYYHIRWSSLLWNNFSQFKWLPEFTWLPLTVLNPQDYADHHFLFHLLQIPFLWFFEPITAAKVSTIVFGTLAIFSVYWLLWRYKVKYLLLWLLAILTCANPFFYRMNMAKAPPLTIIYTVTGIYLLFERKYFWLLPLSFIFVWTYSLFPLIFVIAGIWFVVVLIDEGTFEWKALAYTTAGIILGNIINPYFPQNIGLFLEHFATKFGSIEVSVGGEWYPYSGVQLLTHLSVALIAMLVGYIMYRPQQRRLPEKATFFLVFSTLLLIWMFRSKRLAEYFPPFAILFFAFSWTAFFKKPVFELPEDFRRDLDPYLDVQKLPEKTDIWSHVWQYTPWVIGAVLIGIFYFNFIGVNIPKLSIEQVGLVSSIKKNEPPEKYANAITWQAQHIPAGERIFNCNWDDFPKLFFYDQLHNYVYGLDPNYLYSKNPELLGLLKDITAGKVDNPGPLIREKFGSKFVFTDAKENVTFVAKILESGWAEIIYEDKDAIILRIRDEQGDPPAPPGTEPETSDEQKALDAAEKTDNSAAADPDEEDNPDVIDPDQDTGGDPQPETPANETKTSKP